MSEEPVDYAQLVTPKEAQAKGAPPVLMLVVPRWTADATKGLALRVYECDFAGDPDRTPAAKPRDPVDKMLLLEVTLDLLPHTPEKGDDPDAPVAWVVSNPKVSKATEANVAGRVYAPRKGRGKSSGSKAGAAFTLLLGEWRFHVRMPDDDGFLDEGKEYEVGWELTDAKGQHRHARLRDVDCLPFPAKDELAVLRGLSTPPRGAVVKRPDGKRLERPVVTDARMGRFSDPARKPRILPAEVAKLDEVTLALTRKVAKGTKPADVDLDVDGLTFGHFLKGGETRRQFVERFAKENETIRAAREDADPSWPLHTKDIRKAYLVVHDIGNSPADAPRKRDHYGHKPTALAKSRTAVAGKNVHAFLNHNGTLAVCRDLASGGGPATVYENLGERSGGWMQPYGISVECVPVNIGVKARKDRAAEDQAVKDQEEEERKIASGELPPPKKRKKKVTRSRRRWSTDDSYEAKDFACEGRLGDFHYQWTHLLLDALADVYIFASARAGHLLTVTGHCEVDRNVILSSLFFEYTKAEVKAFDPYKAKHRNGARDVHGDPYGLDMQVFYDKITAKLNALGGEQLPAGVRYGVHPRRVTTIDGVAVGNKDGYLHTFPYQSSREIQRLDPELQAPTVSAWAASIKPIRSKDAKTGRGVVSDFEPPGPWWEQ